MCDRTRRHVLDQRCFIRRGMTNVFPCLCTYGTQILDNMCELNELCACKQNKLYDRFHEILAYTENKMHVTKIFEKNVKILYITLIILMPLPPP